MDLPALTRLGSPPNEREWSAAQISLEDFPFATDLGAPFKSGYVVYRFAKSVWVPHFLVMQSAVLKSVGVRGFGLYPLKHFAGPRTTTFGEVDGEALGLYTGKTVLRSADTDSDLIPDVIEKLVQRGSDKLLHVQQKGGGFEVVSGDGVPFLWRMNDATGIPNRENNVKFTKFGTARALVPLRPLPPLERIGTLNQAATYELLVDYGLDFWKLQTLVGTKEFPLDVGVAI